MIAQAFASTDHPLLAHIIPIRRCNLACEYCNEYDDFSKPVPTEAMFQRVDKLAALGTSVITISGGEPLLHRTEELGWELAQHVGQRRGREGVHPDAEA